MPRQSDDCGAPRPPTRLTSREVKEIFLFFHHLLPHVFASDPRPRVLRWLVIKQAYHSAVRQFHSDKGSTSTETIQRVIKEGQKLRDHIRAYGDRENENDYKTSFVRIDWREGRDKESYRDCFFKQRPPKPTAPPPRDPENPQPKRRPRFSSRRCMHHNVIRVDYSFSSPGLLKCQFTRCKQLFRCKKAYQIHLFVMHRRMPGGAEDVIAEFLSSMPPRFVPRNYNQQR